MGIETAIVAGTLLAAGGAAAYTSNQAAHAQRQAMASVPKPPPLPAAATPPTLASAANATKASAKGANAATAAGTIGDSGPRGLTEPPKTANLTLLGGTK